jgi:hypothetical protein
MLHHLDVLLCCPCYSEAKEGYISAFIWLVYLARVRATERGGGPGGRSAPGGCCMRRVLSSKDRLGAPYCVHTTPNFGRDPRLHACHVYQVRSAHRSRPVAANASGLLKLECD